MTTERTLMVIGAGPLQVPVIREAAAMGLHVVATDRERSAPGFAAAHDRLIVSTLDEAATVEAARSYHAHRPLHGVLTVATDTSLTVAAVAEALQLPGISRDTAFTATHKVKMRERFQEHGVPGPDFAEVFTLDGARRESRRIGYPVVLKPVDNMGARGVRRVDSDRELPDAFTQAQSASRGGSVILETYMEGPELSLDAVIYRGKVTICGVADRLITFPPYFVEMGHTMPSHLPSEQIDTAVDVFTRGIQALGITTGTAKGDIKLTPRGGMVGEIAARLSGGYMSTHTYPYSTGVNLMRAAVRLALGEDPGDLTPLHQTVCVERAVVPPSGRVTALYGRREAAVLPGVRDIITHCDVGDICRSPTSNVEKAMNIICTGPDLAAAEAVYEQARSLIHYQNGAVPRDPAPPVTRARSLFPEYTVEPGALCEPSTADTTLLWEEHRLTVPMLVYVPVRHSGLPVPIEHLRETAAVCQEIGCAAVLENIHHTQEMRQACAAFADCMVGITVPAPSHTSDLIECAAYSGASFAVLDGWGSFTRQEEIRWQDILSHITEAGLSAVYQGVLSEADTRRLVEKNVKTIIVGNRGAGPYGPMLPAPAEALPRIQAVCPPNLSIFLQSSVPDGMDLFLAAAHGAAGLAVPGPAGHVPDLSGWQRQMEGAGETLRTAMRLAGISELKRVRRSHIRREMTG
jgi:biotin carboxylase